MNVNNVVVKLNQIYQSNLINVSPKSVSMDTKLVSPSEGLVELGKNRSPNTKIV